MPQGTYDMQFEKPVADGKTVVVSKPEGGDLASQFTAQGEERIANMARIRILAAFGIVWFHTEHATGRGIGYAGLPIFLMVSCSLIAAHSYSYSIKEFVSRRSKRLLVPWVFWSLVYAVFKSANALRQHEELFDKFNLSMLITGTSIHLWYLPYAFLAAVLAYVLTYITRKISPIMTVLTLACVAAGIVLGSSVIMSRILLPTPGMQWLFALGALPAGFAFGHVYHVKNSALRSVLFSAVTLVMLISLVALWIIGDSTLTVPYSLATVMVFVAHIWHGRFDGASMLLDSYTYGIYLVHILVSYSINVVHNLNSMPLVDIVLTFILSIAVVYVIKQTFLKRFV
jgi:peptidoglycan/LPS O-acetylase OafA/YrhL